MRFDMASEALLPPYQGAIEEFIAALSLLVAFGALVFAIRSDYRSERHIKAVTRVEVATALRSRFMELRRRLPLDKPLGQWTADEKLARRQYWFHAYDEWYLTTQVPGADLSDLWVGLFLPHVKIGYQHVALRSELTRLSSSHTIFRNFAEDLLSQLEPVAERRRSVQMAIPAELEYARRVYDNVESWYTSADNKAQILLTINGILIAAAVNAVLSPDTATVAEGFGPLTWGLLIVFVIALLFSVAFALAALGPRGLKGSPSRSGDGPSLTPERMWFFGSIAQEASATPYIERLRLLTLDDELEAMGHQIHKLAGNVRTKHRAVGFGFIAFGISLISLVTGMTAYAVRL